MDFNLFKKKKENLEKKQTDEIKKETISTPPFKEEISKTNETNFNNPFTNESISQNQLNQPIQQNPFESNPTTQNTTENLIIQPITNLNQNSSNSNLSESTIKQETNLNIDNSLEQNNNINYDEIQEMIDETVEKLIEEKWEKLLSSVDKVLKWKDKQENQMNLIKEDIVFMKENLEKVENKIINKISSYDKNILDVNSEIKAMEKVFQKITPTLINNVNELSKIADDFKEIKHENKLIEEKNED